MLRRQLAPNVLEHLLKALQLESLRASAAAALCNLASEPSVTWLIFFLKMRRRRAGKVQLEVS